MLRNNNNKIKKQRGRGEDRSRKEQREEKSGLRVYRAEMGKENKVKDKNTVTILNQFFLIYDQKLTSAQNLFLF
jgi:hypothetical protein